MISTKTRTSILATVAALGFASALPAVSQARPHRAAKTHTTTAKTQTVTTMARRTGAGALGGVPIHVIHPVISSALQAGSAGVPGYGDATCEGLANDYNKSVDELEQGVLHDDEHQANLYGELANRIYAQMSDNCLVVD